MVAETWIGIGMSGLQLAVAYWLWRGPHLTGTRYWGAGMFALNGAASAWNAAHQAIQGTPPLWSTIGTSLVDRWSDLFLLGFLAAAATGATLRKVSQAGLFIAIGALTVASLAAVVQPTSADTDWNGTIRELPLLLGVTLLWPVVYERVQRGKDPETVAWLLCLLVIGLRHAELVARYFAGRAFSGVPTDSAILTTRFAASSLATGSLVVFGIILAVVAMRHRSRWARRSATAAVLVMSAGLLFGSALRQPLDASVAWTVTLGLARPVGFLMAQAQLPPTGWPRQPWIWYFGAGGLVYAIASLALFGSLAIPGVHTGRAIMIGAATLLAAAPGAAFLVTRLGQRQTLEGTTKPPTDGQWHAPTWKFDHQDVTLPANWQALTDDSFQRFLSLPERTQAALAALPKWKRIVLALAPFDGDEAASAYSRSTPGLHFQTHCPYVAIGGEINRVNARADAIWTELSLDSSGPASTSERVLIEAEMGRIQKLKSGRVKRYWLTPDGHAVAEAIRLELELPGWSRAAIAGVVAEGFPAERAKSAAASDSKVE